MAVVKTRGMAKVVSIDLGNVQSLDRAIGQPVRLVGYVGVSGLKSQWKVGIHIRTTAA